ncbi:hypothetical protein [Neobacillus terrae]|uniref:hypothetical protein n=1 Tax=Neobacillus terrae TaxID=3034837 RepID=UPI00140A8442|nr:hypothetical protein [Neobacillus terrae]NHM30053.1 hypothetical protein [Neobacillus terrae]
MSKMKNFTPDSVIFIGERPNEREIKLTGKPVFYDALCVSKQPEAPQNCSPYQYIPLIQEKSFCLHENQLEFILHHSSLQLNDEKKNLTANDAMKLFSSFMIKKQNRLLFISENPNIKIRNTKKDHFLQQASSKELEE